MEKKQTNKLYEGKKRNNVHSFFKKNEREKQIQTVDIKMLKSIFDRFSIFEV